MTSSLYLPLDEVTGSAASGAQVDFDRAADFLELAAYFSADRMTLTSDLASGTSIGASEDHADLDKEMKNGEEELVGSTVYRIDERRQVLGCSYPFKLENQGEALYFVQDDCLIGQTAYLLCLILSNLESVSTVLTHSDLHPSECEVRSLRNHFQHFATAALAAEIRGQAWSFGFPRRDHSGFISKLKEIWTELADGQIDAQVGAPAKPKDDQIDVFAAKLYRDRLPGFLFAAAQVATGINMRQKPLKGHLKVFKDRWFSSQPATEILAYMIVPFAIPNDQFVDDVRTMGNVLHRLRVPLRVAEAEELVSVGVSIEGYDQLVEASRWLADYRMRAMAQDRDSDSP